MLRSRFEISRNWTILLCSSVTKRKSKSIFMPRMYDASRSRRNSYQRVESIVLCGPVSDIKVCSIEVQVQSLFQDQTESWVRIVNGIDKFVREAMPIQEEENASGKPAAKASPKFKPSSTFGWDFTFLLWNRDNGLTLKYGNPRIVTVFKCRNSSLDHFDRVNKFIEKKMEESFTSKLLMNARESNSTILNIGQSR